MVSLERDLQSFLNNYKVKLSCSCKEDDFSIVDTIYNPLFTRSVWTTRNEQLVKISGCVCFACCEPLEPNEALFRVSQQFQKFLSSSGKFENYSKAHNLLQRYPQLHDINLDFKRWMKQTHFAFPFTFRNLECEGINYISGIDYTIVNLQLIIPNNEFISNINIARFMKDKEEYEIAFTCKNTYIIERIKLFLENLKVIFTFTQLNLEIKLKRKYSIFHLTEFIHLDRRLLEKLFQFNP